jgi:dipeptidyl aminopeptidase/acylaminoacyl peptidase
MLISGGKRRLNEIKTDRDDVYWLDARPDEGGRIVIMRRDADGHVDTLTPPGFNARNAVHEYGGGSYAVRDGTIFITNWVDQRIYKQHPDGAIEPLTAEPTITRGVRFADLAITPNGNFILCVRETHTDDGHEATNEIVAVDTATGEQTVVASGRDFYCAPRVADTHDGIAWTEWDHPNMPWDGNYLVSGSFNPDDASVSTKTELVGGPDESIVQPTWSKDGTLHFVTDRTGWWNIHAWRGGATVNLLDEQSDHGRPDWQFAFTSYAHFPDGRIAVGKGGVTSGTVVLVDPASNSTQSVEIPYSEVSFVTAAPDANSILFVGASPTQEPAIISLDLETECCSTVYAPSNVSIDPGYLSAPQHIIFPTTDDGEAHAYYYEPTNKDFEALSPSPRSALEEPNSEYLPPLVVICHGGPTSASGTGLDLSTHYWTSRGFAVVDVNYRGSSGYGKAYRDALKEKWGIYDTDDCIAAAQHLIDRGLADKDRVIIRGGSAGGYTTINALTFHDFFAAGAALYGIADLMVFIGDTHKFESRYLDSLVGPYPQEARRYHDRSAINFMDQLATPMIILQGLEDEIVPPSQAEIMLDALESKGLPYAYIGFPGEQHGFRQAKNIVRAQEAELYFYGKVLGFEPADNLGEDIVEVRNLD